MQAASVQEISMIHFHGLEINFKANFPSHLISFDAYHFPRDPSDTVELLFSLKSKTTRIINNQTSCENDKYIYPSTIHGLPFQRGFLI